MPGKKKRLHEDPKEIGPFLGGRERWQTRLRVPESSSERLSARQPSSRCTDHVSGIKGYYYPFFEAHVASNPPVWGFAISEASLTRFWRTRPILRADCEK